MYPFRNKIVKLVLMLKVKILLSCILTLLTTTFLLAQNRTIRGKVVNATDQSEVVGATVSVKGSTQATTTSTDGTFSLTVPSTKVTLVITYVGFADKEVEVGANQNNVNVEISSATQQLSEVVVTALGVTKTKKSLNYSTQTVEPANMTKARETNVANSLSGRVAGLDVVRTSNGVGSSVRLVLRGDRSIAQSSGALVIVDGIPGDLGSLNPDDIASMNVLKGSSASALYGSDAANGAIIVTTKKGASGKGLAITFNSSFQGDKVKNLREFQNEYSQGSKGDYISNSELGWGTKISGQTVKNWSNDPADDPNTVLKAHPNNYDDFFSLGKTYTNTIAVSGGGEKVQAYFSYTNIAGTGIVDNNKFLRHNFNFRVSGDLTSKLSFDTKITYFDQKQDNYIKTGESFENINRQIIRLPTNISVDYIKDHYQYYNENKQLLQNYWRPGSNGGENPYWVKNNISNLANGNSVKGMASLTYKFLPNLSLMGRTGLNRSNNFNEERRFRNTYVIAEDGYFNTNNNTYTEVNNDLLLTYSANLGSFDIHANAGAASKTRSYNSLNSTASALVNENIFTLNNAQSGKLASVEDYYTYEKQSVYGSADFSYNKFLVLSVTGRNDWSSALPKTNWSYFFGSAGLTAVISDMVQMPDFISLLKLRGSIAQTGIDPAPFQTKEYYSITPGGGVAKSQTNPVDTLKPEITTSQEYGIDFGLFHNRLNAGITFYKTNSKNQLINVATPPASGYSSKFINAGNVQNTGIEITLDVVPVQNENFRWSFNLNYAKNNNKVISLSPKSPQYYLGGDGFMNRVLVVEGRPFGEMYSRGFERDNNGNIIVRDDGIPRVSAGQTVYIGNSRPKWNGGIGNQFDYKQFSLSFLITARMGGMISSFTDANIYGDGFAAETLKGRDGFVVDGVKADGSKNTTTVTAEEYWLAIGGRNTPVGEVFTYSASNIRLREVVLSYNFSQNTLQRTRFIKGATISLTGRNIMFFRNDTHGFDPEMVMNTGSAGIGIESFSLPFSSNYGLNLNLNF